MNAPVIFTLLLLNWHGILTAGIDVMIEDKILSSSFDHPVGVIHKTGRSIYGYIESASDTRMVLKNEVDAGEVVYTLYRDDIAEIVLPGRDIETLALDLINDARDEEALPLLQVLYAQRSAFLGLLTKEDVLIFTHLINAYLQSKDYAKCIAVARRLDPFIENPRVKQNIKDALLLCQYHLGDYKEAEFLALLWVAHAQPFHSSALGWWVLAMIEFSKDQYESALWISMKPIVFSGQVPMDFLNESYAVAIAACIELNNEKEAAMLLEEMRKRRLSWPDISLLASYAPG